MAKLRVILEFDIQEAAIPERVLTEFWGGPQDFEAGYSREESLAFEQQLIRALAARPDMLRRALAQNQLPVLHELSSASEMCQRLNIPNVGTLTDLMSGPDVLLEAARTLEPEARRYFLEDPGVLVCANIYGPLFLDTIQSQLSRISVEDEQGLIVSTDDVHQQPRRSKKGSRSR